jgi:DNA replication and repair protein RecF
MLQSVNQTLGELYRALARTGEALQAVYECSFADGPLDQPEAEIARRYRARLDDLIAREIDQGVSLAGPQRDDFSLRADSVHLGTYGSRGQQRLAVLALKLAEAEFMCLRTGERPVLLLDDIFSELDSARRRYVQERIALGGQALITATEREPFSPAFLELAQVFEVERGLVRRA